MNWVVRALKKSWYVMSTTAAPLYLNTAAISGFTMRQTLGYGYRQFIMHYRSQLGDMCYRNDDLRVIWDHIVQRERKHPGYLASLRKQYLNTFRWHERSLAPLSPQRLRKKPDEKLLTTLQHATVALTNSVGIAHICDAVGVVGEWVLPHLLLQYVDRSADLADLQVRLTAPTKPSFLQREERELLNVRQYPMSRRRAALRRHSQRYWWIRNTYEGPRRAELNYFARRLHQVSPASTAYQRIHRSIKLSRRVLFFGRLIGFVTAWQDERKERILKAIGYLGTVIQELGRRSGMPRELLRYLSTQDIRGLRSIADVRRLRGILRERSFGCLFELLPSGERVVSGQAYKRLVPIYQTSIFHKTATTKFMGSVAFPGRVTGQARICLHVRDIRKVRRGDILVTSMTRPEILPAMKRAAAFVTDEGGITSHAAIVAREMKKPCIIGTKIATKVLKDGDRVEVDATKGVVRKLP